MLEKTRSSSLLGCRSFTGKALDGRRPGGRIVEGLDVVGKLLRQDRGTTRVGGNGWRGRRRGRFLRRHGARVSGSRLVRWARSAHRDTRRLDASATFFGGGVPMSISPKDALKSVVTRTMDSFSKFSEHRDNANGYGLTVVGRENPANQNSSRRNSVMPPSCARQGGGRAPLARGWLRASIHEPTRRKDEDQQSDL